MSEHKTHQFRPPLYHSEQAGSQVDKVVPAARSAEPTRAEQQGWDAYRKWLSRVGSKPAERSTVDHSIYSWKGYNNWADRVRENWKTEES
jgi:hypothetical protein